MLIAGQVNPAPIAAPDYCGVYLSQKDDLDGMIGAMRGAPLQVEHNGAAKVGRVLHGWTDPATSTIWALAEIDVSTVPGAITAAAVERGSFKDFSLGYTSQLRHNQATGRLEASGKRMVELSVVKTGARPNCHIAQFTRSAIAKPRHSK